MMLSLLGLLCGSIHAGMIHGIVIEHATSRPLARTTVQLQTIVDGSPRTLATAMTNLSGQYYFPSLRDGEYLVTSSRSGYHDARWGQRRPTGPGAVIVVTGESATFAELRMRKFAAISGKVMDENRVAIQGIAVIAYSAQLPLNQMATAKTDDRGIYRLYGLLPGSYWVRSVPLLYEDGSGILPTYFPATTETRDARPLRVELESDLQDIDLQPLPGKLFKLSGKISCGPVTGPAKVTLSSDAGRKDTAINCPVGNYSFEGLAPTNYEVLVVPVAQVPYAAYREVFLDRDSDVSLQMSELPAVSVTIMTHDRTPLGKNDAVLVGSRRDLSGVGDPEPFYGQMLPGYWEVYVRPKTDLYFERITVFPDRKRVIPFTGEINAPVIHLDQSYKISVNVVASRRIASIGGTVTIDGQPAPNAPVYLYPMDAEVRKRVHGVKTTRSSAAGTYRFGNLPPGRYQVISTYDLDEITGPALEHAHATEVVLDEGKTATVGLALTVH